MHAHSQDGPQPKASSRVRRPRTSGARRALLGLVAFAAIATNISSTIGLDIICPGNTLSSAAVGSAAPAANATPSSGAALNRLPSLAHQPPHNKSDHYYSLVERYRNCTYVIGNLEITWLDSSSSSSSSSASSSSSSSSLSHSQDSEFDAHFDSSSQAASHDELDLGFLSSIREITGYLLIAHVNVNRLSMPNLQIIRGRDLFKLGPDQKEEFGMILIDNQLRQLELPNLREILAGSIGSYNNNNLCHIRTINWDEIINWPTYKSVFAYNSTIPECAPCHPACQGSCWAPDEAEMCQRFSKINCSPMCGQQGRCYGPAANECCHSFCAGGCTGPSRKDCLACKNFYDDGECKQECPSMQRYNPTKFLWEPNPNGKYAFGATCVRECPKHLLRDNGACVRTCPPNKRSLNNECVACEKETCDKNCQGVEVVHSGNIDRLINCTVIEGSITILDKSFTGYQTGDGSAPLLALAQPSTNHTNANSTLGSIATSHHRVGAAAAAAAAPSTGTSTGTVAGGQTAAAKPLPLAPQANYEPLHPSKLDVFETVREITGYLSIQAKHPDFKSLSMFRNLRTIGGSQTIDMHYALSITHTSLVSLNLRSLRKVRSGRILIEDNPELCFADTIDWSQINITQQDYITTRNNADPNKCQQLNLQCHEQCARDGCWGPNANECLSCNNYKLDDYCVTNCSTTHAHIGWLSYDSGANTCKRCHQECRTGCNGTEASDCLQCKRVKDGPYCKSECPGHKFVQLSVAGGSVCQDCDKSCVDGCSGPSNRLGEGGCNSCQKAVINGSLAGGGGGGGGADAPPFVAYCIQANETCPDGYYQEYVGPQAEGPLKSSTGKPVCRKCHHRCKSCTGMGTHTTVCECAKYVAGEQCEDYCPRDYFADESSRSCVKCSAECNGCFGPTEADCISCRVYRIYYDSSSSSSSSSSPVGGGGNGFNSNEQQLGQHQRQQIKFNCTAQCPHDKPHRISESNMLDPYCSEDALPDSDAPRLVSVLFGSTTSAILFTLTICGALMVCLSVYRCQVEKDKTVKLTMHLSGIDDVEPLTPSHMKPNLAPLRSIKETELRKGKVLGSGFGGTVYQGFWFPEGRHEQAATATATGAVTSGCGGGGGGGASRPVAIKVLRDNGHSNNLNKEFLEEAYIMASVNHPNLVRLLAVCMTPNHFMLVTQLMPLGCLLEYVKKHKQDIGAKNLLEWGKQIARGMSYLEEHRLVHRDLALRNVLLQTSGRALISDFGLAKFLELDQSEYHSGGGLLPIKWLAPECIRERKFTHKSDVWAFGVTLWELVTFGKRPFDEYDTKDVPQAIEKGARLAQPSYVSADVYKCMYSCWFYSAEDRPNFRQLERSFVQFARDPERYLICGPKMFVRRESECELATASLLDFDAADNDDDDDDDESELAVEGEEEEDVDVDCATSKLAPEVDKKRACAARRKHSSDASAAAAAARCHLEHNQNNQRERRRRNAHFMSSIGGSGSSSSSAGVASDCCDVLCDDDDDEEELVDDDDDDVDEEDDDDDEDVILYNDCDGFGDDCAVSGEVDECDADELRRQQVVAASMQPDLTPSTHNRLNEMRFGFELADQQRTRRLAAADASAASPPSTYAIDANNNSLPIGRHKRWSIGAKCALDAAEQPTDQYDYLLPSPLTNGHDNAFGELCPEHKGRAHESGRGGGGEGVGGASKLAARRHLPNAIKPSRLNLGAARHRYRSRQAPKHQQQQPPPPPHSAGLLRAHQQVTNEEYFLTLAASEQQQHPQTPHYVNAPASASVYVAAGVARAPVGALRAEAARELREQRRQRLSASSGNIPHSLV